MTNLPNSPFLRQQRLFPQQPERLTLEVDRMYTDVANAVNFRTLGTYNSVEPSQNGESWYQDGLRYSGLRQFWRFDQTTPATNPINIPHGIRFSDIFAITKIYGSFTDGTNWYPFPYVDVTDVTNQVSISVTPANIVVTAGAGSPPSIQTLYVVLEWLSNA